MHNKRLESLRNNPGGDWSVADFEITASQYAVKFRKVTKKKISPLHVKAFVAMIDRMDALDL
jgi:hypothetical protein